MSKLLSKALIILITSCVYCADSSSSEINSFKQQLVNKFKFKMTEVNQVMKHAKYNPKVISLMESPYEKKSYTEYRKLFVSPKKVANGKKFMEENKVYLDKISSSYNVPPEIITAIIGVESNYHKVQTNYHALDSLYTLAFFYPKRSKFFKSELEQFLLLCRDLKVSPESISRSYAGALGMPQFMPSSYRRLAASTENHYPDLFRSKQDAMVSIANYLNHFGWVKNQDVAIKVNTSNHKFNVNQELTVTELNSMGINTPNLNKNIKLRVLDMNEPIQETVWLGLTNLKVIKSYNNSDLYALAVFELANQIKQT